MNDNLNWTKIWSKRYPILAKYQDEIKLDIYIDSINDLLDQLIKDYKLSEEDAMLVLKDILYNIYKDRKRDITSN